MKVPSERRRLMDYYLAIDIDTTGGRHVLGSVENNKLVTKVIYEFGDITICEHGITRWNLTKIKQEIINGLKECKNIGCIPKYVAVDTVSSDFILLDAADNVINVPIVTSMIKSDEDDNIRKIIGDRELFDRTGICRIKNNTIYQMLTLDKEILRNAQHFLMLADYINFFLTGNILCEYTNAQTTQLVNIETNDWDYEMIENLALPTRIFSRLNMPQTTVGMLKQDIEEEVLFNCNVILTCSARKIASVNAVPQVNDDIFYIIEDDITVAGIESVLPIMTDEAFSLGIINGIGNNYKYMPMKVINAINIIKGICYEFKSNGAYDDLCEEVQKAFKFPSRIDTSLDIFNSPQSYALAIEECCRNTGQLVPETFAEVAACAFLSIADTFARVVKQVEEMMDKQYLDIYIIGEGTEISLLNKYIRNFTLREVHLGTNNAASTGNIMIQLIKDGICDSVNEARKLIV